MPTDSRLPWLRLAHVPSIGPVLTKRLLESFHTPDAILSAHPAALSAVEGIGTLRANQIVTHAAKTLAPAQGELERIDHDRLTLLTPDHPDFPPGLKNIPDPPLLLYVRGKILPGDAVAIGIVGARQCTTYGREQARRFAAELAEAGLAIVSGGARGIDSASHLGALQAKGRTLVVQGCGLRHTYPPENKSLYERIVNDDAGAVISEFPLDAPPTAENFPPRNRIIAALSLGILVIEANLRSGSLITARLAAADYGREVFALPGPITSAASTGTHHLIKTGAAHLVDSVTDILQNLGEVGAALLNAKPIETTENTENTEEANEEKSPAKISQPALFPAASSAPSAVKSVPVPQSKIGGGENQKSKIPTPALTSTQQKVLAALSPACTTTDDLIDATGLPPNLLIAELTILQIKNLITRLPANRFAKTQDQLST